MERKISKLRPLVGRLNRAMDREFEIKYLPSLPEDIGPQQGMALNFICRHPGCNSASIMERLLLKKSTVSEILTFLQEEGYVSCLTKEGDKRSKEIFPTEKGIRYYESIEKVFKLFENDLTSLLTAQERDEFLRIGEKMLDQLEEEIKDGR